MWDTARTNGAKHSFLILFDNKLFMLLKHGIVTCVTIDSLYLCIPSHFCRQVPCFKHVWSLQLIRYCWMLQACLFLWHELEVLWEFTGLQALQKKLRESADHPVDVNSLEIELYTECGHVSRSPVEGMLEQAVQANRVSQTCFLRACKVGPWV